MIRQKLQFSRIPRPVKSVAESFSSLCPSTSGLSGISSLVPAIPPVPVVSSSVPAMSSSVIKSVAESTFGVCCVSSSPAVSCVPSQSTCQSTCTVPSQPTCSVPSQSTCSVPSQSTCAVPSQSTRTVPSQSTRPFSSAVKSAPVSFPSSPVWPLYLQRPRASPRAHAVPSLPVPVVSSSGLSSPVLVSSLPVLAMFPFRLCLCLLSSPVFDRCSSRFVTCPVLCPVPVVCLFCPF